MTGADELGPEEIVVAYHERTKHHFHRFAASPGYLDWESQPDPFRRFWGAPLIPLPLGLPRSTPYRQLFSMDAVEPATLSIASLSDFFRYSLSLTAWKRFGTSTWSLRANPSSGNLHPTEGYALLPALEGLHDGPALYHYAPREHGLERRADLDRAIGPPGTFLVGLSSILWREAWKYGERAFRYCQHDVGHALGALRISAALLGWRLRLLPELDDATVARLLALDHERDFTAGEREHPDLLAVVSPATGDAPPPSLAELPKVVARHGRANVLSPEHRHDWPVIEEVARAAQRAEAPPMNEDLSTAPAEDALREPTVGPGGLDVDRVILGRRSAVAMDGETSIPAATFYRMLARTVPTRAPRAPPWDAIAWRPRVHLGLFVHRVDGLEPGLYALVRDPEQVEPLRAVLRGDFLWQPPAGCPPGLPLFLLEARDARAEAAAVSCRQGIAGDGAFSLGMIAALYESLERYGPAFYRNLFWEAGLIGQVLYLEAEDAGIRATGIGCYFDDPVHALFGVTTRAWQSLYHFAVGGPLEDVRLTTLPPYEGAR